MPKPKQVYRHLIIFGNSNSEENTVPLLPLTEPHDRYILRGLYTKRGLRGEHRWALLTLYCLKYLSTEVVDRILDNSRFHRGKDKFSFVTWLVVRSRKTSLSPLASTLTPNVLQVMIVKVGKTVRFLPRSFIFYIKKYNYHLYFKEREARKVGRTKQKLYFKINFGTENMFSLR